MPIRLLALSVAGLPITATAAGPAASGKLVSTLLPLTACTALPFCTTTARSWPNAAGKFRSRTRSR